MTLTAFTVTRIPDGPYIGCTWGGSSAYGPASGANTRNPGNLRRCSNEATWEKTAVTEDVTWCLCDQHRDVRIKLRPTP